MVKESKIANDNWGEEIGELPVFYLILLAQNVLSVSGVCLPHSKALLVSPLLRSLLWIPSRPWVLGYCFPTSVSICPLALTLELKPIPHLHGWFSPPHLQILPHPHTPTPAHFRCLISICWINEILNKNLSNIKIKWMAKSFWFFSFQM